MDRRIQKSRGFYKHLDRLKRIGGQGDITREENEQAARDTSAESGEASQGTDRRRDVTTGPAQVYKRTPFGVNGIYEATPIRFIARVA